MPRRRSPPPRAAAARPPASGQWPSGTAFHTANRSPRHGPRPSGSLPARSRSPGPTGAPPTFSTPSCFSAATTSGAAGSRSTPMFDRTPRRSLRMLHTSPRVQCKSVVKAQNSASADRPGAAAGVAKQVRRAWLPDAERMNRRRSALPPSLPSLVMMMRLAAVYSAQFQVLHTRLEKGQANTGTAVQIQSCLSLLAARPAHCSPRCSLVLESH